MIIRRERHHDAGAVQAIHAAAFARDDGDAPLEPRLVDQLRHSDAWLPHLSIVAAPGGTVIGHGLATRGTVGDTDAVAIGPIAVHPSHQGRGAGTALMHALIAAADARDEPLIALLGAPVFYSRFGFTTSTDHGIDPPDPAWGRHFQVLPLHSWHAGIAGRFTYAAPFDEL